jgi:hypothetical protein
MVNSSPKTGFGGHHINRNEGVKPGRYAAAAVRSRLARNAATSRSGIGLLKI